MWLKEAECEDVIGRAWTSNNQPPKSGFYKANIDGATRKNGHDDIEVVIWDSRGLMVSLIAYPVQYNNDSDLVESLALWKAVTLAKDLGIRNIHVEGDSLTTIKAINSAEIDRSHIGGITEAIKAELNLFTSSVCSHIRRISNSIANELARLATSINDPKTWVGDIHPPFALLTGAAPILCFDSSNALCPYIEKDVHPSVMACGWPEGQLGRLHEDHDGSSLSRYFASTGIPAFEGGRFLNWLNLRIMVQGQTLDLGYCIGFKVDELKSRAYRGFSRLTSLLNCGSILMVVGDL
ncbi:hypothetical protein U1Q18_007435, partial [Sarracenia purpurea var. burkii]